MTVRDYEEQFTVPAGTAINAPFTQTLTLEDNQLNSIRFVIPDGHNGTTGLRLVWSGTQHFPYNTGAWFTGNDEKYDVQFDEEITEGAFTLAGYNTDIFAHTFILRIQISDLPIQAAAAISSPQSSGANNTLAPADITSLIGGDTSGLCFDINGNQVDCGDPNAVTGPVVAAPPPPDTGTVPPPAGSPPPGGPTPAGPPPPPAGPPPGAPQPPPQRPPIHSPIPQPVRPPTGRTEPPGGSHSHVPEPRPRTGRHAAIPPPGARGRPVVARPLPPPPS